jgi:uncharacterized protein (DUF433 family)
MVHIGVPEQVLHADEQGVVRIGGSRITLDVIVADYRAGRSAEEIALAYPALSLAEVYAAIAYYLAHRDEVDRYCADGAREAGLVQRKLQSLPGSRALRERIVSLRQEGTTNAATARR